MKTMDKTLTADKLESIKQMFLSDDKENWEVGLAILKNNRTNDLNLINSLILFKETNITDDYLHEKHIKYYQHLKYETRKDKVSSILYCDLVKMVKSNTLLDECLTLIEEKMSEEIYQILRNSPNYDFIKNVTVKI